LLLVLAVHQAQTMALTQLVLDIQQLAVDMVVTEGALSVVAEVLAVVNLAQAGAAHTLTQQLELQAKALLVEIAQMIIPIGMAVVVAQARLVETVLVVALLETGVTAFNIP
jgi:hypothetical protein